MNKPCAVILAAAMLLLGSACADEPIRYEAETGVISGPSTRVITDAAASSFKAVGRFESPEDRIEWTIQVPETGVYDLVIRCKSIGGSKLNNLLIDGQQQGQFECSSLIFAPSLLRSVPISAGEHTLAITPSWGWIVVDYMEITPAAALSEEIYHVTPALIDPDATAEARALYAYLRECYGKVTLAGQVCDKGMNGPECQAIHAVTGKYPAMIGFDMMEYTPSRVAQGARGVSVDNAIRFHEAGGIVTFCWHWGAPKAYIKDGVDSNGNPRWWGGFYTENTTFDIEAVMSGADAQGRQCLDKDIEGIARQLLRLQEAGVPVLWRPLHEASGGWFWWGAKGPEPYKQLWCYLYDQLTNVYGCHNLIWVWNGQHIDWYPGDAYVDIIGEDIYADKRSYASQHAKFTELTEYASSPKIIALTENGVVYDIDLAIESGTRWAWFNTWSGDFVQRGGQYSEAYTEAHILRKAYDSEYVITLDELPRLY